MNMNIIILLTMRMVVRMKMLTSIDIVVSGAPAFMITCRYYIVILFKIMATSNI